MDGVAEQPSTEAAGPARAAVILGNDAILAARPHNSAQLTHACGAAGFDIILPPSWGDELVARAYLDRLPERCEQTVFACACDRVRALMHPSVYGDAGCVSVAAPPVAAARYLRRVYGDALLVTYVGDCPSATDPSIDARFSPAGFFASLHRQGITLDTQPNEVAAVESDRWRRFESTPGGLPALRFLGRVPVNRVLREAESVEAGRVIATSRSNVLVDLAAAANCACAANRDQLVEIEPPRAATPIVAVPRGLDLSPESSVARVRTSLRAKKDASAADAMAAAPNVAPPPVAEVSVSAPEAARLPEVSPPSVLAPASRPVKKPPPPRNTGLLAIIPLLVLGAASALGIGVYRMVATTTSTPDFGIDPASDRVSVGGELDRSRGDSTPSVDTAAANAARLDSLRADSIQADSAARADSVTRQAARRVRQAPQVVPGWMPQGQRRFSPADTVRPPNDEGRSSDR